MCRIPQLSFSSMLRLALTTAAFNQKPRLDNAIHSLEFTFLGEIGEPAVHLAKVVKESEPVDITVDFLMMWSQR